MLRTSAFLSAHDKGHIPELAKMLHDSDYQIISLGKTAELIANSGVPVVQTTDFLKDLNLQIEAGLPERTKREIVAVNLAQTMALQPALLKEHGWPVISFSYINLMPPVADAERDQIKVDKSGVNMISAALEGGRTILVEPSQISEYLDTPSTRPDDVLATNRLLACHALEYLEQYSTETAALGRAAFRGL